MKRYETVLIQTAMIKRHLELRNVERALSHGDGKRYEKIFYGYPINVYGSGHGSSVAKLFPKTGEFQDALTQMVYDRLDEMLQASVAELVAAGLMTADGEWVDDA